jgi:hypothetical protein
MRGRVGAGCGVVSETLFLCRVRALYEGARKARAT